MGKSRIVPLSNVDVSRIVMELQLSETVRYVEYTYTSGLLTMAESYKTTSKTDKLFTVTMTYNSNSDIETKTITRETDGKSITWSFTYDTEGKLISKTAVL